MKPTKVPKQARDWGLTFTETIILVVIVVLAIFGLIYILSRN